MQNMRRPTQIDFDDATTAAKLQRTVVVVTSAVTFTGTLLFGLVAVGCCQHLLLLGNAWFWGGSSLLSLVYLVRCWQIDVHRPPSLHPRGNASFDSGVHLYEVVPVSPSSKNIQPQDSRSVKLSHTGASDVRREDAGLHASRLVGSKSPSENQVKSISAPPAHWPKLHQEEPPEKEKVNISVSTWKMFRKRVGWESSAPKKTVSKSSPQTHAGSSRIVAHSGKSASSSSSPPVTIESSDGMTTPRDKSEAAAREAQRLLSFSRQPLSDSDARREELAEDTYVGDESPLLPLEPPPLPPPVTSSRQMRLTACGQCLLLTFIAFLVFLVLVPLVMRSFPEVSLPNFPIGGGANATNLAVAKLSGASWVIGEWSACSSTCGVGVVRRQVSCGDWSEGVLPHGNDSNGGKRLTLPSQCVEPRPESSRPCGSLPSCSRDSTPEPKPSCMCDAGDVWLPIAGLFNAFSGWGASFTCNHYFRASAFSRGRAAEPESRQAYFEIATSNLLAPASVLLFGAFALLASVVLGGIGLGVAAYLTGSGCSQGGSDVLVASGLVTASVMSAGLWSKALCFLVAPYRLASKRVWCFGSGLLIVFAVFAIIVFLSALIHSWLSHVPFGLSSDASASYGPAQCMR